MAEMPMPQEAQQPQADPAQLVQQVSDGLNQLGAMAEASGQQEAVQALTQIVQAFQMFIESMSQGQDAPQPADQGQAPMETGGKPSQPAL